MFHSRHSISPHSIRHAYAQVSSFRAKHKGSAEKLTGQAIRAAEVGGAAFGVGLLNGRFGAVDIMGIPLDLAAGVALHGAAALGLAGKYDEHIENVGNGVLAAYATKLGAGMGAQMRTSAGKPALNAGTSRSALDSKTWTSGAQDIFAGDSTPVTKEEMAALMHATR